MTRPLRLQERLTGLLTDAQLTQHFGPITRRTAHVHRIATDMGAGHSPIGALSSEVSQGRIGLLQAVDRCANIAPQFTPPPDTLHNVRLISGATGRARNVHQVRVAAYRSLGKLEIADDLLFGQPGRALSGDETALAVMAAFQASGALAAQIHTVREPHAWSLPHGVAALAGLPTTMSREAGDPRIFRPSPIAHLDAFLEHSRRKQGPPNLLDQDLVDVRRHLPERLAPWKITADQQSLRFHHRAFYKPHVSITHPFLPDNEASIVHSIHGLLHSRLWRDLIDHASSPSLLGAKITFRENRAPIALHPRTRSIEYRMTLGGVALTAALYPLNAYWYSVVSRDRPGYNTHGPDIKRLTPSATRDNGFNPPILMPRDHALPTEQEWRRIFASSVRLYVDIDLAEDIGPAFGAHIFDRAAPWLIHTAAEHAVDQLHGAFKAGRGFQSETFARSA